jgi:hypothetical protein
LDVAFADWGGNGVRLCGYPRIVVEGNSSEANRLRSLILLAKSRRLIGWQRINLKPGETQRVTISADPHVIASYDVKRREIGRAHV